MNPLRLHDLQRAAVLSDCAYSATADGIVERMNKYGVQQAWVVEERNTRAIITWCPVLGEIGVAFAGTDDFFDMLDNVSALPVFPHIDDSEAMLDAVVHSGFWKALGRVFDPVVECLEKLEVDANVNYLLIAGHSLGGAMANLAALRIPPRFGERAVITFGMPRAGCKHWGRAFEARCPAAVRVVHDLDDIPSLPGYPFKHCGKLVHLSSRGEVLTWSSSWWRAALHRMQGFLGYPKAGVTDHLLERYTSVLAKVSPSWKYPQ